MDPGVLLRAVRRARRLNQRELAQVSGVPATTIGRIEAGRTAAPSLRLIEQILNAAGYHLVIVNAFGVPIMFDEEHERLRDDIGRHFPAHLRAARLHYLTLWRGWNRAPYYDVRKTPPAWIYLGRSPHDDPWYRERRWHDAT